MVPEDFIGCGVSAVEWLELSQAQRMTFTAARDALMQRQADMIVDTLMERFEEDAEDAELSAMMDAAERKKP